MNLSYEIRFFPESHFVGLPLTHSIAQNRSKDLWSNFMPRRKEIQPLSADYYSIQSYAPQHFNQPFNPKTSFEIWAMMKVEKDNPIPTEMKALTIPSGNYAVFAYKGTADQFSTMAMAIYSKVIPESKYHIAERPHFQIMGPKYFGPENPNSEEEIWVPVC